MEIYYVSISSITNGPLLGLPPSFPGPSPSSATEDRLAIPIIHTTGVEADLPILVDPNSRFSVSDRLSF